MWYSEIFEHEEFIPVKCYIISPLGSAGFKLPLKIRKEETKPIFFM